MGLFSRIFFKVLKEETCNVCANELKPGDKVKDINPECKEKDAKGTVKSVKKIKDGSNRVAGNLIEFEIENKGVNYKPGEKVKKTEIQLKKIKESFKRFLSINEQSEREKLLTEIISKLEELGYLVKIKNSRVIAYTKGNRYDALKKILNNFEGSTYLRPDSEQVIRVASIGYIVLKSGISVVVKPIGKNRKEAEEKASNDLDKLIKDASNNSEEGITIKIGDEKFENIVEASTKVLKGDPKADIALIDKDGESVAFISHKKGGGAMAFQQYGGLSEKSGTDVYTSPLVGDFVNDIHEYLKSKDLDNTAQPGMSFLKELPNTEESKKLIGKSIYGKDWNPSGNNFGENFVNCIGQGDPELKEKNGVYELNFSDDMHTYDDLSWAFIGEYKACLGATYRIGRQIKNESVTIKDLRGGIYPFVMLSGRNFIKL